MGTSGGEAEISFASTSPRNLESGVKNELSPRAVRAERTDGDR